MPSAIDVPPVTPSRSSSLRWYHAPYRSLRRHYEDVLADLQGWLLFLLVCPSPSMHYCSTIGVDDFQLQSHHIQCGQRRWIFNPHTGCSSGGLTAPVCIPVLSFMCSTTGTFSACDCSPWVFRAFHDVPLSLWALVCTPTLQVGLFFPESVSFCTINIMQWGCGCLVLCGKCLILAE